MAKSRGKKKSQSNLEVIVDLVDMGNAVFQKLTGKSVPEWFEEFRQRPEELPPGKETAPQQPAMPLANAYAVLGLPPTASPEEVKRNYRNLSVIFHPDKGGYEEAMKLLNRAYERIQKGGE